ncbi:MAG: LysR family transcriptional regulator, partial [Lachnospiraceae bacterium]|nr:LysR family transcriptional regulator [Lachnospiraceae bacterium]
MELYQLDFFRILCKHGNFTSASDELNVTQPAVSTAVKKLEEELGKPLIDRNDKGFALTRAGEIVLGHAVN